MTPEDKELTKKLMLLCGNLSMHDLDAQIMKQAAAAIERLSAEVETSAKDFNAARDAADHWFEQCETTKAELAALRAQNEHLIRDDNVELSHAQEVANSLIERNVKLEQELAALRKQIAEAQPVAYMFRDEDSIEFNTSNHFSCGRTGGTPLYTHPAADAKDAEDFTGDVQDLASIALRKAWQLGQTYWQQADSEYYSQNKKSDDTFAKFQSLVEETRVAIEAAMKGGA